MNEREEPLLEDDAANEYDPYAHEIEPTYGSYMERFLSLLPPIGKVLDAACGTGKYFPMVLASGRSVLGVDHVDRYLSDIGSRFPEVPTGRHDLQDLPYRDEFDGVMCMDAMEFIPPEDWPIVLDRFRNALHGGGWLYLTVELHHRDDVRAANDEARRAGLPVVDGEVIRHEAISYYHYYPSVERVRAWVTRAGFAIEEEAEGPWHEETYAYHHVLARLTSSG